MSDTTDMVDTLLGVFRKLKGEKGDKKRGWIFGVLAAGVAALIIGLLSWRAYRTGKKLAALQHQADVLAEQKEQAKAQSEIDKIDEKIKVIDEALQTSEETYTKAKETIDEIQSWDDFDQKYGK